MKRVSLTAENCDAIVAEAAEILTKGGVIVYPTDTLYGLGGDALSDAAFEKVCAIKERDDRRPMHAIFASLEMAAQYAHINEAGEKLAREFLPGPLTLIFDKKPEHTTGIMRTLNTIGVRIPKKAFCVRLAKALGKPYTTTSANITGKMTPASIDEIVEQLGEHASSVDMFIDDGLLPTNVRSTIVDVREAPFIIREGVITREQIFAAVK